MDDLVSEFIEETMESLVALDTDLVELENNPADKERLDNIFRLMHTIKGTCGFIGLPRLEKLSHAAENLLDSFRNGTLDVSEQAMTVLFMSIDRVRYIVTEIHNTTQEPDGSDDDLISLIENELSGAPPQGAAASHPAAAQETREQAPMDSPAAMAAESEPAAAPAADKPHPAPEYLRVQIAVLEELVNKVSELVLTRNQLSQLLKHQDDTHIKAPFQSLNRIISDLQDRVMQTRMQPIGHAWAKFPRLVRDLCAETGKKIILDMQGEETELDRQVLEMIKDPLTHMIRNACDHGIEHPAERTAGGKADKGHITLKAAHEGGHVIIRIIDDGKGLDPHIIGEKAVEKGLVDRARLSQMSDKEIFNLIMMPGFSTAQKITSISGRGVGMDVVRANIEKIGGSIEISSTPGEGSAFTIQIPLTLAIISALIIGVGNETFAIPQMSVQEVVSVTQGPSQLIEYVDGRPVMRLRNLIIPLLDNGTLFSREAAGTQTHKDQFIVVVNTGMHFFGVLVDSIDDIEEIVIKPLAPVLKNTAIFSGSTILGNGQVIMILDPASIARRHKLARHATTDDQHEKNRSAYLQMEKALMLTFIAGTGMPKSVPLALVSRLQVFPTDSISFSGGQMVVTHEKQIIPLYLIDADTQILEEKEVTAIILKDDMSDSAIGLVIDKMLDVIEGELNLKTTTERPGIIGSVILSNGMTTDVLDISHYLDNNKQDWFSTQAHMAMTFAPDEGGGEGQARQPHAGESAVAPATAPEVARTYQARGGRPRLLLVDDSQFFRNMLHPILQRAGYDVTLSDNPYHSIQLHDNGEMFDVILSDIEMPGMTGYEFVQQMRKDSAWKETPFIAITSHNTSTDSSYGYKLGFDYYIGKFDKDTLLNTLKAARGEKL